MLSLFVTLLTCATVAATPTPKAPLKAGAIVELDVDIFIDPLSQATLAKYGERILVTVAFNDPNDHDEHAVAEEVIEPRPTTLRLRLKVPKARGKKPLDELHLAAYSARKGHRYNLLNCGVEVFKTDELPSRTSLTCALSITPEEIERSR